MSKARDLANAGTALTTVSATELGYLDGVTSAVQTQLNAKQATVSGVDSTEIGYLDGVTSSIQTQLNARVPNSTITTKGDLIVGTGSGTYVRQAVGSDGQYLQADSTQADGVKWAAIASSGMTLINRTSFSAAADVTLDNIFSNTYENYVVDIQVYGSQGGGASFFQMRGRRDGSTTHTAANYEYVWFGQTPGSSSMVGSRGQNDTVWGGVNLWNALPYINNFHFNFYRPSSSAWMHFHGSAYGAVDGRYLTGGGAVASNQNWTGLYLFANSGNITGQVSVYGLAKS